MSLVSKATAPFIARARIKFRMWFGRGDDEDSLVYYVHFLFICMGFH